jgi:hypothetical protein
MPICHECGDDVDEVFGFSSSSWDGFMYCDGCWAKVGVPSSDERRWSSSPKQCSKCNTPASHESPLYAPASSDASQWLCETCLSSASTSAWKRGVARGEVSAGTECVPYNYVRFPPPVMSSEVNRVREYVDGHALLQEMMGKVVVSDYAFVKPDVGVYQTFASCTQFLRSCNANVVELDAYEAHNVYGDCGLVVWASPHAHVAGVGVVSGVESYASNDQFNVHVFEMLCLNFPRSHVVIPFPERYSLARSNERCRTFVNEGFAGLVYEPQASDPTFYNRLCLSNEVVALSNKVPSGERVDLSAIMISCLLQKKRVLFLGEYLFVLSATTVGRSLSRLLECTYFPGKRRLNRFRRAQTLGL